ncbi:MAG: hypothetical protein IJT91_04015 [Clostridia bacterium]|nr:hypothetical protein [Clostridia bacterium]
MNNNKEKRLSHTAFAAGAASVIFAVIYIVLLSVYYEKDTQFFKYGAFLPNAFLYLTFFIAAAFIVIGFSDKSAAGFDAKYNRQTPFMVFGSVLSGLLLLVSAVNEIFSFINPSESAMEQKIRIAETVSENSAPFDLTIPIIIFSIISVVFFILQPFKPKFRLLGIAFIIRMALYVVQGYFSKASPLNSPVRIMDQMSCILIMIYFVYDVRFIVGEGRPKHYLTFAPAAIFVTGVSAIGKVVCTFTGLFEFNGNTYSAMFRFAIFAYMLSRYLPYVMSGKYGPIPEKKTAEDKKQEIPDGGTDD